MRVCWNRQTGELEVLVFARAYGFKSHHAHQIVGAMHSDLRGIIAPDSMLWVLLDMKHDF